MIGQYGIVADGGTGNDGDVKTDLNRARNIAAGKDYCAAADMRRFRDHGASVNERGQRNPAAASRSKIALRMAGSPLAITDSTKLVPNRSCTDSSRKTSAP